MFRACRDSPGNSSNNPENGSWTQMNADNRRSNKKIFREKN